MTKQAPASALDVAVTGAAGDLGQHVVRELLLRGHSVRALVRARDERSDWLQHAGATLHDGDLFDERSLHRVARGATGMIHCAARESHARRDAASMRSLLVEGTSAVLRVARRRGVERIVHVSSMLAVGLRRDDHPMDENTPWRGSDLPPVAAIHARREAEERVLTAARAGLPAIVVNPDVMVGARADGAACTLFRVGPLRRVPARGGSIARIEDVASGCCRALELGVAGRRYILGGENRELQSESRRIALASDMSAPRLGPTASLRVPALALARFIGRPPTDAVRLWGWNTYADSTRARDELGYSARPVTRP